MAKSLGIGLYGITQILEEIKPDLVFIEGDRGESLAGAISATHLNIPIVHHGGGDLSGSIDDKIRSAITVLSDFHLTGNQESYLRLINSGIVEETIAMVGEPGLDDIILREYTPEDEIDAKFCLLSGQPLILLMHHPDTKEILDVETQMRIILDAINELEISTIAVYSNADSGGRIINSVLEKKAKELPFFQVFPHLERRDFLGLLDKCTIMLGNSSAGIVELPSFKKPFVCIGSRQNNRLRAGNTLNVNCDIDEIIDAVHFAMHDSSFIEKIKHIQNPYGDGCASEKIVSHIMRTLESIDGNNN